RSQRAKSISGGVKWPAITRNGLMLRALLMEKIMPNAPALLIAGCGDIGSRVGLRLATQGWRVQGLRRHVAGLPSALQPLYADLASPHCPEDGPQAAPDYVFYAVAAQQGDEAGYRAAYVEGLRNLLGCLDARGQQPRRLLFVSSTDVYAQQAGEWVD